MKIYVVVDSQSWCWSTTAQEVAKRLPQHEFFITATPHVAEATRYDLIWIRGYAYLFRNAFKAGVPVVWTFCTGGARAQDQIDRCRIYLDSDATIICQNENTRAMLAKAGARKVVVIPNGVDCDLFRPSGTQMPISYVGMAANVNGERWHNKGAAAVVAACHEGGFGLVLATNPKPGSESKAPEYDLGRIDHSKMPEFLRGLDAFAQPSNAEGCSNSIMEAMACGLPCIICRESGYHGDVCRDGREDVTGEVLFVEHGNVDEIRDTIEWVFNNPWKAGRIGKRAREFAERHSWDEVAKQYAAEFDLAVRKSKAFHLVTVATRGYEDALRRLLPTWVANSGAESITVYAEDTISGLPGNVRVVCQVPMADTWVEGCMRKASMLCKDLGQRTDGDRIAFVDCDCAILADMRPLVAGPEDLALTRFSVDPARYPRCAGTCSSGVVGIRVNAKTRNFVNLWDSVQCCYAAYGHGTKPGKVACDQYALTDLARGRACGVSVRAMDERIWNSNPETDDDAWLAEIRTHKPAVLHFKGGRWKDEDLVRRAIEAARRDVAQLTVDLGCASPDRNSIGDAAKGFAEFPDFLAPQIPQAPGGQQ